MATALLSQIVHGGLRAGMRMPSERSLAARLVSTNVEVVCVDATRTPVATGTFSGAVCLTMLHHVPSHKLSATRLNELADATFRDLPLTDPLIAGGLTLLHGTGPPGLRLWLRHRAVAAADLAQPQARLAIEKLAGDLQVAGAGCGFFDHVQNRPAQGGDLGIDLPFGADDGSSPIISQATPIRSICALMSSGVAVPLRAGTY